MNNHILITNTMPYHKKEKRKKSIEILNEKLIKELFRHIKILIKIQINHGCIIGMLFKIIR